MPTTIELRVHGVHGTPPEAMLGTERACQVDGDDFGRVFRRADRLGAVADPDDGIEAYHWSKQTSGSPLQGLWLLLAPFGMVNAAQYMLEIPEEPPVGDRRSTWARWAYGIAGGALRLTGASLTLMFVLTASIMTLDLWAWQRERAATGAAFALALAGPVALMVFYFVVARTKPKLNGPPDTGTVTEGTDDLGRISALLRPGFFEGDPDVPALRYLHLAAGSALVAVIAFAQGPTAVRFGSAGLWVAGGLLVIALLLVLFLSDPEGSADLRWAAPTGRLSSLPVQARLPAVVLFWLSVLALLAAGVRLCLLPFAEPVPVYVDGVLRPRAQEHFGGIDAAAFGVMLVAVLGLLLLLAANVRLAVLCRASPARTGVAGFRPYAMGMGCTLVASVGVFLGVGFAGAFTTSLAKLMSTDELPVGVPEILSRITYAWGLTVGLVVLLVIAGVITRRVRRSAAEQMARAELGGPGGERPPSRWVRKLGLAIWIARLKNTAPCVLTIFAAFGGLLTVATVVETYRVPLGGAAGDGWPHLGWLSGSAGEYLGDGAASVVRDVVVAVGALALSGLAGVLVALGRNALTGETSRRGANVIWDVIAFWPRSAHPFVPATYAQRAVPDLEDRIGHHLRSADGRVRTDTAVVLCGHSQGSLLAFAALLRLAADPGCSELLGRVGLLTFGSQLQVMFSRGFPGFVNHATITHLHEVLLARRWRNLYRNTDPVAGPVLSWASPQPGGTRVHLGTGVSGPLPDRREHGSDWLIFDPPAPVTAPGGPVPARGTTFLPRRGHSDYWLDAAWGDAVKAVSAPPG